MTTQVSTISKQHDPGDPYPDIEPDLHWKTNLRKRIETELQPTVDRARRDRDTQLARYLASPAAEKEVIAQQHASTMDNIRRLAQEQYTHALERERKERKWILEGQIDTVLLREQQAILDTIQKAGAARRHNDDGPSHKTDEHATDKPATICNGEGTSLRQPRDSRPERQVEKPHTSESGQSRVASTSKSDVQPETMPSPRMPESECGRSNTSRAHSSTSLAKERTSPEIWHPPLPSTASKTSGHVSTTTTAGPGPRDIWRPASTSVLQSHEAPGRVKLPFRTPPPAMPKPLTALADLYQPYQPRPTGETLATPYLHSASSQASSRRLPGSQAAPVSSTSGTRPAAVQQFSASGQSTSTLQSDPSWHDPSSSAGTSRRSSFSAHSTRSQRSKQLYAHSNATASDHLASAPSGNGSSMDSEDDEDEDWEYYDEAKIAVREEELCQQVAEIRERQRREAGKKPGNARIRAQAAERKEAGIRRREEMVENREKEAQRREEEIARKEEMLRQKEEDLRGNEDGLKSREEELSRREQELHRYEHEAARPQESTTHRPIQRTRSGQHWMQNLLSIKVKP